MSTFDGMSNLFASEQERDFFVYVDPRDLLVRHQVGLIGSFNSMPSDPSAQTLMFLPNPEFKTFISPFHSNLLRNYIAEYNLELSRKSLFPDYPCVRLICPHWNHHETDRWSFPFH